MRVPNVSTRDFAFAYNWENIVCFDYDRDTKEHINYGLLENLKNGALWSPKYESKCKNFREVNVKVVCFANYAPDYSKLSDDRWRVFHLVKGKEETIKLKRVQVPKPIMVEILVTEEKSLYVPNAQSKFIPKSDDENKLVIDEDESFEIPADLKNFIPFQVFEESANEDDQQDRAFHVEANVEPSVTYMDSNLIELHE